MEQQSLPMRWTEADWLAEVTAWIHEQVQVAGEIEQPHVQHWSTVLKVPTAEGDLWFKAVAPIHHFEPRLTALLAQWQPGRVPEVLAIDTERAWMLMRDGGTRLRDLPATVEHWERVLPRYAELQIAVAPQSGDFLQLGVPDERLAGLALRVKRMVEDAPEGLRGVLGARMLAQLPEVESLTDQLVAHSVPETIQHDDLHDGQVFVRDGGYLVFDWGDACVSHPFHTLTVTLRAAAWKLGLEPGGSEVLRMRNAYLEPFGSPEELAPIADVAYRTGTLARAVAWHRFISAGEAEERDSDVEAVAYGVEKFLEAGPIGTWE
jgi:Phosphotransferase enzyme family